MMTHREIFAPPQGSKICEGAVTKQVGSALVQLCEAGKLRYRKLDRVAPGYPRAGGGKESRVELATKVHED